MRAMTLPRILVHGGAWAIPDELVTAHRDGCRAAARRGWRVLTEGGSAEDAVEAAVRAMEDDETFDAGRGSFLNRDGFVETDAAIMEGRGLNAGAVAAVRDIAEPITLARRVMESDHVLLVGEGASRYAESVGVRRCPPSRLVVQREVALWRTARAQHQTEDPWGHADTVGAIAIDSEGHLVAGVSTGGRPFKLPGRVGDVPCPGCGFYADDGLGAAVSTGEGEAIMRVVMAKRAVDLLSDGLTPQQAAESAIAYLGQRVQGRAGILVLGCTGDIGVAFSTARMARSWNKGCAIVAHVDPL